MAKAAKAHWFTTKPGAITAVVATVGIAVIVLVESSAPTEGDAPSESGPSRCDNAMDDRLAWLETPNSLRDDHLSPKALGFRAAGRCSQVIAEKQITCDYARTRIDDSPYLIEARAIGFTTYRCETLEGDITEVPMSRVDLRWTCFGGRSKKGGPASCHRGRDACESARRDRGDAAANLACSVTDRSNVRCVEGEHGTQCTTKDGCEKLRRELKRAGWRRVGKCEPLG